MDNHNRGSKVKMTLIEEETSTCSNGSAGKNKYQEQINSKPDQKMFIPRNSLYTDLWDNNAKIFYHVLLSILTGLAITTAVEDYASKGTVLLTLPLIYAGFSQLHVLFLLWCLLFVSTVMVYVGFKYWAIIRSQLLVKAPEQKWWDFSNLVVFVIYCLSLLYFATYAALQFDCGVAELMIYHLEVIRFLMKSYAFVRSNVPRALAYKSHLKDQVLYPEFSKFLYYMFAPTLLYRDNYPRTTQIRWKFVFTCLMEIIGVIFFVSFILHRFVIHKFEIYGIKPFPWYNIVVVFLEISGLAFLCFVLVSYAFMHCLQNAFAEMLRFSDRLFYKDWWMATDLPMFFRRWSFLVHEWLYAYFFKDIYEVFNRNKTAAIIATFLFSFLFHDYFTVFAFRAYMPLYTFGFVPLLMCMYFSKIKNETVAGVFMWYGNAIFFTFFIGMYAVEYFARINCPKAENLTFYQKILPNLFRCYKAS